MGCYYKRKRESSNALQYLFKAIKYKGKTDEDKINAAGTHINIWVIMSQLHQHESALEHAKTALSILQKWKKNKDTTNFVNTIVVAYYNIGVEQEFLKQIDKAESNYRTGLQIAQANFENSHPLIQSIWRNLDSLESGVEIDPDRSERITKQDSITFQGSLRHYEKKSATSFRKTRSPDLIYRSFSPTSKLGARVTRRRHVSENRIRKIRTQSIGRPSMPMPAPPILDKPQSKYRVGKYTQIATSITKIESKLNNLSRKMDTGTSTQSKNQFQKRRLLRPTLSLRASERQQAALLIQKVWKGFLTRKRFLEAKEKLRRSELKALSAIRQLEQLKRQDQAEKSRKLEPIEPDKSPVPKHSRGRQHSHLKSPMPPIPEGHRRRTKTMPR